MTDVSTEDQRRRDADGARARLEDLKQARREHLELEDDLTLHLQEITDEEEFGLVARELHEAEIASASAEIEEYEALEAVALDDAVRLQGEILAARRAAKEANARLESPKPAGSGA